MKRITKYELSFDTTEIETHERATTIKVGVEQQKIVAFVFEDTAMPKIKRKFYVINTDEEIKKNKPIAYIDTAIMQRRQHNYAYHVFESI